jgi:L-threonylcarbamoyladenylate synthase
MRFILTTTYEKQLEKFSGKKVGVMLFFSVNHISENTVYRFLSEKKSLKEGAANLYSTLIELDAMNLDVIIAVYVPNKGIGKSINDRLERAATL